jgi:hypothetical protein
MTNQIRNPKPGFVVADDTDDTDVPLVISSSAISAPSAVLKSAEMSRTSRRNKHVKTPRLSEFTLDTESAT